MKQRVLVLNQDYSPITICTVHRGFLLVFLNKAELVAPYKAIKIRTVDRQFEMPAVIRIQRYINVPYKGVMLTRQNIFKRDKNSCQYCTATRDLTIDHIIPRSKGGKSTWTNLITACKRCNSRKGDFTPEHAGMRLLSKPYKPNYTIFLRDHSGFTCEEWEPFLAEKATLL
jgi:5-methylcytosine-specific restriction endonuclease McrA